MTFSEAVGRIYAELGTWREVADFIGGLSPAYWRAVAKGETSPSARAERLLRRRLGLPRGDARRLEDYSIRELAWLLRHRQPL